MALINCPECGKEVSDEVKKCIHCGYPIEKWMKEQKKALNKETEEYQKKMDKNIFNNKKIFFFIGAAVLVLFIFFLFGTHIICFHKEGELKCKEPITCIKCGKVLGDAPGHDFPKNPCETTKCSRCTASITGLGHSINEDVPCDQDVKCEKCGKVCREATEHKWTEANCKAPKTCTVCKVTEGQPTEHNWEEANCGHPKTCKFCKKTEGSTVGEHEWIEATCTEPKTCKKCKSKEGKALGHKYSDYEVFEEASLLHDGRRKATCEVCGTKNTETIKFEIERKNGVFNFKAIEWVEYVNDNITAGKFLTQNKIEVGETGYFFQFVSPRTNGIEAMLLETDKNGFVKTIGMTGSSSIDEDNSMVYYMTAYMAEMIDPNIDSDDVYIDILQYGESKAGDFIFYGMIKDGSRIATFH